MTEKVFNPAKFQLKLIVSSYINDNEKISDELAAFSFLKTIDFLKKTFVTQSKMQRLKDTKKLENFMTQQVLTIALPSAALKIFQIIRHLCHQQPQFKLQLIFSINLDLVFYSCYTERFLFVMKYNFRDQGPSFGVNTNDRCLLHD